MLILKEKANYYHDTFPGSATYRTKVTHDSKETDGEITVHT